MSSLDRRTHQGAVDRITLGPIVARFGVPLDEQAEAAIRQEPREGAYLVLADIEEAALERAVAAGGPWILDIDLTAMTPMKISPQPRPER